MMIVAGREWCPRGCSMESNPLPFDSETLLSKANGGRTIATYRRNQIVFSQGEPADAVFYIQQGQVKLTVLSEPGKEAVVAIFRIGDFFGHGCFAGQPLPMAQGKGIEEAKRSVLEEMASIQLLPSQPALPEVLCANW